MPGRKSNVSTTSNAGGDDSEIAAVPKSASKEAKEKDGLSVEDISLPKSMIARLAKGVLPANTQIHRDALLALHKSATVFVSYIASNSNEAVQATGKKTIQPQDVMAALKDAEFENFIPRLEAELKKYNDTQCDKRNNYRRKIKEEKAATAVKDGGSVDLDSANAAAASATNGHAENGDDGDDDGARPFKKFRTENGVGIPPRDDDEDADVEDDEDGEQDGDDQDDDDVEDDNVEDEEVFEDAEEGINQDDSMEDVEDTFNGRGATRDEALDEVVSD